MANVRLNESDVFKLFKKHKNKPDYSPLAIQFLGKVSSPLNRELYEVTNGVYNPSNDLTIMTSFPINNIAEPGDKVIFNDKVYFVSSVGYQRNNRILGRRYFSKEHLISKSIKIFTLQ